MATQKRHNWKEDEGRCADCGLLRTLVSNSRATPYNGRGKHWEYWRRTGEPPEGKTELSRIPGPCKPPTAPAEVSP